MAMIDMLDTKCRKYVQPIIKYGADICMKLGLSANNVTVIALFLGIISAPLITMGYSVTAVLILWFSGYLDAVDGTIARTKGSTPFGTVMDITFDRIVEIGIIFGIFFRDRGNAFLLLLLASAIIVSMTIFLTTGSMAEKKSEKSFYYQSGIAERTEGFIMFSLMILFSKQAKIIGIIFLVMIIYTAIQRYLEAKKILS